MARARHRRTRSRTSVSGWTLIEILICTAILSVLMSGVLLSLVGSRSAYLSQDAYLQVQQEARRVLESMIRELHEAGSVNNNVSIVAPGVQRLDFQIVRAFDPVACGGTCWGTDEPLLPSGWIHYVVDGTDPQNGRLWRCTTAGRLDAMPAHYTGCRVLGNRLDANVNSTAFTYDHTTRVVTIQFQTVVSSQQLPGGQLPLAVSPLTVKVSLRNTL